MVSGAKSSQTLSRLKALAAVNCLKAWRCFEELCLCLLGLEEEEEVCGGGDGGLSRPAWYSPRGFVPLATIWERENSHIST